MADQDYNRGTVGGTNWWDSTATARTPVSDSVAAVSTSGSSVVVFPPDHSMGLGLSSDQPPWNHPTLIMRGEKAGAELGGGGGGGGFRSMLQQGMTPFSTTEPEFKPIKGAFSVDQPFLDTSSYGNFQALMGGTSDQQGGGGSGFGYPQQLDYGTVSGGGGWNNTTTNKVDHLQHQFLKPNSMADKPNPSFWNMETAMAPSSFFPPLIPQHQINIPCFEDKPQHNVMEVRDTSGPGRKMSGSLSEQSATTTSTGGTANKRSRNEASSTLPPFKVRKEKMGDRITALQQLVSPFGKTDTASVLSEAIEYIKFLHEQVNVLSTPYLKSGASLQQQQTTEKDPEGARQDLRSRGLCLVPVSSTFPVAHETTVDFWTPTFGGTFR